MFDSKYVTELFERKRKYEVNYKKVMVNASDYDRCDIVGDECVRRLRNTDLYLRYRYHNAREVFSEHRSGLFRRNCSDDCGQQG